jgi:hypothetical protein
MLLIRAFFITVYKLQNLPFRHQSFVMLIVIIKGHYYTVFDIQWIYLAPFLYVIGGGTVIFRSFTYAYVSESAESKHL